MKQNIHPQYYPNAKATCACGAKFEVGSTKQEIRVEVCSHCHPFYTGKAQLLDVAGRVERFKARRVKADAAPKKTAKTGKTGSNKK
ncbi:MAG: 50S ribosomal protein L31 [Patescibacteria group bacterium]